MKKKTLGVLVALLLVIGAGAYTYARYTTSFAGSGNAEVAKWAVKLTQGDQTLSNNFTLEFTAEENENVVGNKIAPGRGATAQLVLDLSGTEVATDVELDLSGVTNLPDGVSISSVTAKLGTDNFDLTNAGSKYSGTVFLENGAAISKTVTFDIKLSWNDSASDATTGATVPSIAIPVTVTASQHISN